MQTTPFTPTNLFGFFRCVLAVLGVPKPSARSGMQAPSMRHLAGKRIVTAFPVAAEKCFLPYESEATGTTKIEFVTDGTDETAIPVLPALEAASLCRHGMADAVVDLVELDANGEPIPTLGFKVVHLIQHSQVLGKAFGEVYCILVRAAILLHQSLVLPFVQTRQFWSGISRHPTMAPTRKSRKHAARF